MGLSFEELKEQLLLAATRTHGGDLNSWTPSEWLLASVGELGEACNVLKKINRHREKITTSNDADIDELRQQLGEEIADTIMYLVLFMHIVGLDIDIAIRQKFNKTSARNGNQERL